MFYNLNGHHTVFTWWCLWLKNAPLCSLKLLNYFNIIEYVYCIYETQNLKLILQQALIIVGKLTNKMLTKLKRSSNLIYSPPGHQRTSKRTSCKYPQSIHWDYSHFLWGTCLGKEVEEAYIWCLFLPCSDSGKSSLVNCRLISVFREQHCTLELLGGLGHQPAFCLFVIC